MPARKYFPGMVVGKFSIIEYLGVRKGIFNASLGCWYKVKCNTCGTEQELESSSLAPSRQQRTKGNCHFCRDYSTTSQASIDARRRWWPGDILNDGAFTVIDKLESKTYLFKCNNCGSEFSTSVINPTQRHCINCRADGLIKYIDGIPSSEHYLATVRFSIIQRCYNPNDSSYHKYGGRGIGIHHAWRFGERRSNEFVWSLRCFADDIHQALGIRPNQQSFYRGDLIKGETPRSIHLGRINHDLGYIPGNLRWETIEENGQEASTRYNNQLRKERSENFELFLSAPWLPNAADELNFPPECAEIYTDAWINQPT